MKSEITNNVISSPESVDGPMHSDLPTGLKIGQSGQDHARASHSALPAKVLGLKMNAIYGPIFTASSPTYALQSLLENKLADRVDLSGSIEFSLIWKVITMPSGRAICRLRALARRISGNAYGGWPTPKASDYKDQRTSEGMEREIIRRNGQLSLSLAAYLAGWATPNTMDHLPSTNLDQRKQKGGCVNLKDQVAAWGTPTARDWKDGATNLQNTPTNGLLGRQAILSTNQEPNSGGALNPDLGRWLMGYPPAHLSCAPMETP